MKYPVAQACDAHGEFTIVGLEARRGSNPFSRYSVVVEQARFHVTMAGAGVQWTSVIVREWVPGQPAGLLLLNLNTPENISENILNLQGAWLAPSLAKPKVHGFIHTLLASSDLDPLGQALALSVLEPGFWRLVNLSADAADENYGNPWDSFSASWRARVRAVTWE